MTTYPSNLSVEELEATLAKVTEKRRRAATLAEKHRRAAEIATADETRLMREIVKRRSQAAEEWPQPEEEDPFDERSLESV